MLNWKNKNVFVTGCTGFVGRHLVEELLRLGANVTGLVRTPSSFKGINLAYGSLADFDVIKKALEDYKIDTVFHMAAQAVVGEAQTNPVGAFETNIRGTWNILEACRQTSVARVIVTSSEKVYGDLAVPPYVESMLLNGRHPYDVSKSCADLIANSYYHTYQLPVCIVRCGNLYGGGDYHFTRLIPQTIRAVLQNEAPVIRSNGGLVRDFFYIEDAVRAHLFIAGKMEEGQAEGEAFHFGYEMPLTIQEVVKRVLEMMKSDLQPIMQNQTRYENKQNYLSAKKARDLLGWKPVYDFDSGLSKTIEWYRRYFN
ncbi:NAD-dependent epimerase/dehydratase family protein [Neobacillus vireti]|uniref:NAD-dependent epimerase/dehydratase family protein n=1 Tax=Neobacillus vireti TaxID=220686 RepID=UPI002FFFE704